MAKANLQTMAEEVRRLEKERIRKKATDSFINKAMINMMQLPLNLTVEGSALEARRESRHQLAQALYERASQARTGLLFSRLKANLINLKTPVCSRRPRPTPRSAGKADFVSLLRHLSHYIKISFYSFFSSTNIRPLRVSNISEDVSIFTASSMAEMNIPSMR